MRRLAVIFMLTIIVFAASAVAAQDDELARKFFTQRLIGGSPWSGRFHISMVSGCSTFTFYEDAEGKSQGKLLRSTSNLGSSPSGELVDVRVMKGGIKFKTPVGAEYHLQIAPDGILTGSFYGATGVARAQTGYIELSPQSQCS